jgi:hypothetical protein
MEFKKGARPIESSAVKDHYTLHQYKKPSLEKYASTWKSWLVNSDEKSLAGLDDFSNIDYTQGTSQTFDQFVIRYAKQKEIAAFVGDFQYHACITKNLNFKWIKSVDELATGHALIISMPFSDLGTAHPDFDNILKKCNSLNIPVCLDLAYWGIAKNIFLDLKLYPCVTEVTASLSKAFYTLENHRVGVRFSRQYLDDGISMLNEVQMQNFFSMSLGIHYMEKFSCDWNWQNYKEKYQTICQSHCLNTTDVIIFGTSAHNKYSYLNRGIPENNRICISPLLKDTINDC